MEDGSDGITSSVHERQPLSSPTVNNGEDMANYPLDPEDNKPSKPVEEETVSINGEVAPSVDDDTELPKHDSSDCDDTLVIDEEVELNPQEENRETTPELPEINETLEETKPETVEITSERENCNNVAIISKPQPDKKRKLKRLLSKSKYKKIKTKAVEDDEVLAPHSNPYFSQSIFELSTQYSPKKPTASKVSAVESKATKKVVQKKEKEKAKVTVTPKPREYPQCVGLQPNVQFKCSKCGLAGFPSLVALNEHLGGCLESVAPSVNTSGAPIPTNGPSSSSNLRFSRKVFLCSSCGTYYENWNLFLHMREIHHRFICLYCLGMFPHPEKLSVHLINKHNCSPKHYETATDYLNTLTEPCFLMCCDCRQVFTEQDQIDAHSCIAGPSDQSRVLPVITINENQITNKEDPTVLDKSTEAVINSPGKEAPTDKGNSEEKPPEESETRTETVEKPAPSGDNNNSSVVLDDSVESMNISESKSLEENVNESTVDKSDFSQDNSELSNDNFELSMTNNENSNDLGNVTTTEEAGVNMEDSGLPSVKESVQRDEGRILCEKIPEVEDETTTLLKSDVEEEKYENSDEKEVTNEKCMAENDQDGESMDEEEDLEERVVEEVKTVKPFTIDTRKVPKVTLKLPKIPYQPEPEEDEDDEYYQDDDSSDSDKLTMQIEEPETPQLETNTSQPYNENLPATQSPTIDKTEEPELETNDDTNMDQSENDSAAVITDGSQLPVAGVDVPVMELELEQPLDKMDVQVLLRQCLTVTIPYCLYCNHARKIAVNGKQLALHAIAEHRYSAIVKSITEEELIPESFNARLRDSLEELDLLYFNLEAPDVEVIYSQVFECFQCRYSTTIHKELYLHNRKLHAKALLLCIMCKTSFLNYSELVCHRCPGFYDIGRVQQGEGSFRCCMCVGERAELPSAFRLMVHLRKRHHLCDVCMESCNSQLKLSSHVWKHKLNHFCYRCGIAYRNKADITKHLYWKHGTESVNCKRCLQKRWPHVYHFCQPAASFTCDDCGLSFSRAVSLRVHRRLHDGEDGTKPHVCEVEECGERFISKRLRAKHEFKHREPEESVEDVKKEEDSKQEDGEKGAGDVEVVDGVTIIVDDEKQTDTPAAKEEVEAEEKPEKSKGKVDVYDLPALNLSESDSSDSEDESNQRKPNKSIQDSSVLGLDSKSDLKTETDGTKPAIVSDSIWDNFKNYQAAKSKLEDNSLAEITPILTDIAPPLTPESVLRDHDYCLVTADVMVESDPIREEMDISADHDYCTEKKPTAGETDKKPELPGKKPTKTTQSSSDSDSSSCTCGSNCSCSSSSASSSSSENSSSDSSSSEGRRRQRAKREKKRQKKTTKVVNSATVDSEKPGKDPASSGEQLVVVDVVKSEKGIREVVIEENDLWTTESDTDEDFYEEHPQKFALKLLAEKRERLLQKVDEDLQMNGSLLGSRPPTPSTLPEEPRTKQRKKSKSKKKKKKKSSSRRNRNRAHNLSQPQLVVAPLTLSIKNSPVSNTPIYSPVLPNPNLSVTITSANHHYNHHHHHHHHTTSTPTNHNNTLTTAGGTTTEENLRASKRRRVPNKFYGYSSDEESNSTTMANPVLLQPPVTIPVMKFRKVDLPSPAPKSPLTVPPLTIKTSGLTTVSTPTVQPISIRVSATTPGELRVQPSRPTAPPGATTAGAGRQRFSRPPPIPPPQRFIPKFQRELDLTPPTPVGGTTITHHQSPPPPPPPPSYDRPPVVPPPVAPREDSATESNETSSDDEDEVVAPPTVTAATTPRVPPVAPPSRMLIQPPPGVTSVVMQGGLLAAGGVPGKDQPALYCYCRCPYDEVSEMIGCDSDECVIEWFHFECVGIMVPPKGQWFCPDCRKKKQQRRELLQQQLGMGV